MVRLPMADRDRSFLTEHLAGIADLTGASEAKPSRTGAEALDAPPPSSPALSSPAAPTSILPPASAPPAEPPSPADPPPSVPPAGPARWDVLITAKPTRSLHRPSRATMTSAVVAAAVVAVAAVLLMTRHPSLYAARWDPRVLDIVRFVENERGLHFIHPVRVDFLDVATFRAKIGAGKAPSAADRRQLEEIVSELRAFDLIQGRPDLRALATRVAQQESIGLYEPKTKHVYVRGTTLSIDGKVTLAHELTHALQDQRRDLQRLERTPGADEGAIRALIEGDAVRVERAYTRAFSAADAAALDAERQSQTQPDVAGIPKALVDAFAFPYALGPTFVEALAADGGTARIDEALANPPRSEADIVNPQRYLDHIAPVFVAAPVVAHSDTRLGASTSFGQVSMAEVLGNHLGYGPAWAAVQGWRGDKAVPYRHGGTVCVAVATSFDTPEHATGFEGAATSWASGRAGASTVRTAKTVELRACDPGAAAASLPPIEPSVFDVLSMRAAFLGGILEAAGIAVPMATCAVDGAIEQLGPPTVAKLAAATPGDPHVEEARVAIRRAVTDCQSGRRRASTPGTVTSTPPTSAPPSPAVALGPPLGPAPLSRAPVWPRPHDTVGAVHAAGLALRPAEGAFEHIHVHLRVVVDDNEVIVPASLGIEAAQGLAPLHTHDNTGVIHVESDQYEPYTLGQVFTEWGVPIGVDHIGGLRFGPDRRLRLFVNGTEVSGDPARVLLRPADDIEVWVGPAGRKVTPASNYSWS